MPLCDDGDSSLVTHTLTWLPCRWMGELRFQLGGVWETLWARNYRCRLYVLPPEVADGVAAATAVEVEKAATAGKYGKAGGGVRGQPMLDDSDECGSSGGGGGGDGSGGSSGNGMSTSGDGGNNGGGGDSGGNGGRQLLEGCPPPGLERSKSSQLLDYPPGACALCCTCTASRTMSVAKLLQARQC